MSYHFSKRLDVPFDQAVSRVTEALNREDFGLLTDIDVKRDAEGEAWRGLSSLQNTRRLQPAARIPRIAA